MKVRKIVIPVAGMGTRFLPATKVQAKEMLPIVDVPTIQVLLEEVKNAGIEEVIFVVNDKKKVILNHFMTDSELEEKLVKANKLDILEKIKNVSKGLKISSVKQDVALGSGHAVMMARELVGNEPFAVMYGDDLIKGGCALKELIEVADKYDASVLGVQEVPHELTYKYGILSLEDEETLKVKSIVEKPKVEEAPSNLASIGRYILKPEIFEILETLSAGKNGEYQLTDAIDILMHKDKVHACPIKGTYYDIGSQLGYLKANIMYGLDREELRDSLLDFMKEIVNK